MSEGGAEREAEVLALIASGVQGAPDGQEAARHLAQGLRRLIGPNAVVCVTPDRETGGRLGLTPQTAALEDPGPVRALLEAACARWLSATEFRERPGRLARLPGGPGEVLGEAATAAELATLQRLGLTEAYLVALGPVGVCVLTRQADLERLRGPIEGMVRLTAGALERLRGLAEARESEHRLKALSDNLPEGLVYQIDTGPDGTQRRFTYLSGGVEQLHEIPAARALEDPAAIYGQIHPEDVPLLAGLEASAIAAHRPFSAEVRVVLPSGRVAWRRFASAPRRLPNGHLIWDGLETDVTDRKRAEEQLQRSEEQWRLLVRNSSDSLVILEADGGQRYVSPAAERMTGFSVAEVQGRRFQELIHPGDLPRLAAAWEEVLAHPEKTVTVEYRHVHRTRGWFYSEAIAQSFLDDPAVRGVIATVRDITERKQSEGALRESEQRFRTLAENLPGVAYLCRNDARFTMLFVGPGISLVTGLPAEDFLADRVSFVELYHPDDAPTIDTAVAEALQAGRPFHLIYRLRHRDGTWRWVEEWGTGLAGAGEGRGVELLEGFLTDITERKQMEAERERLQAQLSQAQKMESVGRLAGGVAHDFNNMLGVILGNAELAMAQLDPASPVVADLMQIRDAAERSANLTHQLLAFARRQTIAPRVIDLNETVESLLKMLRRLMGEDVALSWAPGREVGQVRMDPTQLDQILANLCVNARDAIAETGRTGRITIETRREVLDPAFCATHEGARPGEYLLLAVVDDGCGMDALTKAHLFEPFFTTKGQGKGTGLGLATVYGIVKQNEGFLQVESAPGRGTWVGVYLPRPAHPAAEAPGGGSAHDGVQGQETVLLVEDEPAILSVGQRMLESLGYRVVPAAGPGAALRLAQEHAGQIHLLVTDVVMPEMNGRDLARNLLALYPDLKRLFMSGYTADVIATHGVLGDGVHFIQKPFSRDELGRKVREALDG